MKNLPRIFVLLLALPLIAVLTLAARPALADTREAFLKRTALTIAHREMFAIGDFEGLDKGLNNIQQEYEQGQWKDFEVWRLFNAPLWASDPAFEEIYNRWVSSYPKSFAARQARGNYFFLRAMGELETVRKTAHAANLWEMPPEEAASVKHLLELSINDTTAATQLAKKPFLAYCNLIEIYGLLGDTGSSGKMAEAANKIAPQNIMARYRYAPVFERTGANIGQLQELVDDARKDGLDNDDTSLFTYFQARLLDKGLFEKLDQEMNAVQKAYEDGKIDDVTLEKYFSNLGGAYPERAPKLDVWIKAYPKSYAARQVRALYSIESAWLARGEKYTKEMSAEEKAGLALYTKQALEDAKAAASLTAKPLLAYRVMLDVAELSGTRQTSETMLRLANTADPKNSVVRLRYMHSLQTRWGGSLEKMENFMTEAKAAGVDGYALTFFEKMVVDEKFALNGEADEAMKNFGQVVTGF